MSDTKESNAPSQNADKKPRGIVVVDTNILFSLSTSTEGKKVEKNPDNTYLTTLVHLSQNGFTIVIPETVKFEALNWSPTNSVINPQYESATRFLKTLPEADGINANRAEKNIFICRASKPSGVQGKASYYHLCKIARRTNVLSHKNLKISMSKFGGWKPHHRQQVTKAGEAINIQRYMTRSANGNGLGEEHCFDVITEAAKEFPHVPVYFLTNDRKAAEAAKTSFRDIRTAPIHVISLMGFIDALMFPSEEKQKSFLQYCGIEKEYKELFYDLSKIINFHDRLKIDLHDIQNNTLPAIINDTSANCYYNNGKPVCWPFRDSIQKLLKELEKGPENTAPDSVENQARVDEATTTKPNMVEKFRNKFGDGYRKNLKKGAGSAPPVNQERC